MPSWIKIVCAMALAVGCSQRSAAFGPDGHHIVGQIASLHLTAAAQNAVRELLGDQLLPEACNWPDLVRGQPGFEMTGPLHYVNVPPRVFDYRVERDCNEGNCIIGAIERFAAVLGRAEQSPVVRAEALKFVCHFIGDLHQPLHVGYAHDRGGNLYQVRWRDPPREITPAAGQRTRQSTRHAAESQWQTSDLHSFWDDTLVARLGAWREQAGQLAKRCQLQTDQGDVLSWYGESRRLVLDQVYADGSELTAAYLERHTQSVADRLALAGCRLAALLNQTLQ